MRIVIHDYGGYAFIVGLSRALAGRGHDVVHLYASRNPTPHGRLRLLDADPASLSIVGVATREPLQKYRFFKRWRQEREYGTLLAEQVSLWNPDIVVSANTPLDAQSRLFRACRQSGTPFVFWVQDLLGEAMRRILHQRIGPPGGWLGAWYARAEKRMLSQSSAVIAISAAFGDHLVDLGVPRETITILPNWAPLNELPRLPRDNPWSRANDLDNTFNYLYSGSLGLKHDPSSLLDLAHSMSGDPRVRVVVVSDGPGAGWLAEESARQMTGNLVLLPFQSMDVFPQVLASADILLGQLVADAGDYSVPSKILAYLCAGRPILLAMPSHNTAARMVEEAHAGLVVEPHDVQGFITAAQHLADNPILRDQMAAAGRKFAESHFDVDAIADSFERILGLAAPSAEPMDD